MSIEKQRLYNEIDTLPEELTNQVINFIEYLKISYVDTDAPDNIMIKSKKDLKESALFTIRCHGQVVLYANSTLAAATGIALNDSTYQTIGFYSDIWNSSMTSEEYICSTDNFSQLDLALLIGCETSYGTTNNLPFQIVNHGAKTAVGFSENILCSNANKWTEDFYFYLSMGYTVQESVAYAKSKSTAESGLKSAQIDGDSSYILIPWG